VSFEKMKKIRALISSWRKPIKIAAYNPQNFDEIFGITTSRINIFSLVALLILTVCFLLFFIIGKTKLGAQIFGAKQSIDKTDILDQRMRLDSLKAKIDAQDKYIKNMNNVLFGTITTDSMPEEGKEINIDLSKIKDNPSKAELKVAENVKADQYTTSIAEDREIVHFFSPIRGYVSQKFDQKDHQAVDIVAKQDAYFLACLSGTVIYSDFSSKDGYVLIIEHSNNFTSIYKHTKSILKKRGDRVQVGEIIGIVGNTGANSTGPHLHFELWLNQKAVDPTKYIQFGH